MFWFRQSHISLFKKKKDIFQLLNLLKNHLHATRCKVQNISVPDCQSPFSELGERRQNRQVVLLNQYSVLSQQDHNSGHNTCVLRAQQGSPLGDSPQYREAPRVMDGNSRQACLQAAEQGLKSAQKTEVSLSHPCSSRTNFPGGCGVQPSPLSAAP